MTPTPPPASYSFATTLDLPLDAAIARTRDALSAEGFGVLTMIDVRQTMRDKLGVEVAPHVILGACNPALAHRGLRAEPDLGLLLPCNVVVREDAGRSIVSAVDPPQMLGVIGDNPAVEAVAQEAARRLRRVVAALAEETA